MKRAEPKLIVCLLLSLLVSIAAQAQDKKNPNEKAAANSAAAKTQTPQQKKTAASSAATANPSGANNGRESSAANPAAQSNTQAKASNQGAKPSAPPSVKLTDILRLDDLHVRVVWQVTGATKGGNENNSGPLADFGGSINLSAEFANGQLATAIATFSKDARSFVFTLTPFTPNNNQGVGNGLPIQTIDPKTGEVIVPAPAGGTGGSKETRSLSNPNAGKNAAPISANVVGGAARLSKATAQLSFNLKQGNQNIVLTDQLTRKF